MEAKNEYYDTQKANTLEEAEVVSKRLHSRGKKLNIF
jgi:hypothetical protein